MVKVFPFLGYKGVVGHQIRIYKKLKKANRDALNLWTKKASPAIGIETMIDGTGIKRNLTMDEAEKFRRDNTMNKFVPPYAENDILNIILASRREFDAKDIGAHDYFSELIGGKNKSLEQVIMAILEWEFLSNLRAYRIRGENSIPPEFIKSYRREMVEFVHKKVQNI